MTLAGPDVTICFEFELILYPMLAIVQLIFPGQCTVDLNCTVDVSDVVWSCG